MAFYVKNCTAVPINVMVTASEDPDCDFDLSFSLKGFEDDGAVFQTTVQGRSSAFIRGITQKSNLRIIDKARLFAGVVDRPPDDRYFVIKDLVN